MKEVKIESPLFSDVIQVTEPTDRAHADIVNAAPLTAFENTLALKKITEELSSAQKEFQTNISQDVAEAMKSGAAIISITIPADGWEDSEDEEYPYCINMTAEESTAESFPVITLDRASMQIAAQAGLCPIAETRDGCIRFLSKTIPTETICGMAALLNAGGSTGGGSGSDYTLPPATATKLGGVKIGNGLNVAQDGTVSVDGQAVIAEVSATEDETTEMMDAVFGETEDNG